MNATISNPLTPEVLVPKIGYYLVEKGLITNRDLEFALEQQSEDRHDQPLIGQILVENGKIEQKQLDAAITEQVIQLRRALEEQNLLLEERVKERTADLEAAVARLSELSELKNNFISNVSHELKTPLTHIKGYIELLHNQDLGPLTDEQIQALQIVNKASTRLENLIENLILFANTQENKLSFRKQQFDIKPLCTKLVKNTKYIADQKHITMLFKAPQLVPHVHAEPDMIKWVIGQLLENAIKFTPDNGKVIVNLNNESSDVKISIQDSGIGIPKQKINEIFEPFHQLDGSSTRKYGGTGLGLALVKKILDLHGSALNISSHEGDGTTIDFTLPISIQEA